ncbi:cytochrome c family protein [Phenylobacterium sp.]|uniref:c-type cytochrome n=1 Tax=Phenylobacterium sp. TaxID=1871053 RepID=UPI0035B17110
MASKALVGGLVAGALAVIVGGAVTVDRLLSRQDLENRVRTMTGGDPHAGKAAVQRRPCGGCHVVPGVAGAKGKVGPPLTGFAGRVYIGGRVNNTPANLVAWIQDPHQIDPKSAMPPMGIGEAEARDIAAFLLTLK